MARVTGFCVVMRTAVLTAASFMCLLPLGQARAQAISAGETAPRRSGGPIKVVLVGDSTVSVGSGWGPAFCARHVTADVTCVNLARAGRSSGSFVREGYWKTALAELGTPGYSARYVLVQFGHNDQPGKPGHSTDLATEFPTNLRRLIADARSAGAVPILVTPLARRQFVGGVLQNSLEPWAEAIRAVGREMNVAVVDLNASSVKAVAAIGPVSSMRFAQRNPSNEAVAAAQAGTTVATEPAPADAESLSRSAAQARAHRVYDHTHLGDEGAEYFAAMVSDLLARASPELRTRLLP